MRALLVSALLLIPAPVLAACPDDAAIDALAADIAAKRPAAALAGVETQEDALCAQEKLVKRLGETLGAPIGYKAGLTSKPAQERFGASGPVRGVLLEKMLLPSGSKLPAAFGARPLFEADMLVTVKDDGINAATTPEEVLRHLTDLRPFIELPDLVFAEDVKMTPEAITAINVGARLGVMGEPIPVEATPEFAQKLADMTVTLSSDTGGEIVKAPGKAILGHPLNAILWLTKNGVKLKAGDVVSLGSFGPLVPAKPGTVTARYEGLPGDPEVTVTLE